MGKKLLIFFKESKILKSILINVLVLNESCEVCKPGYVESKPPKRCYRLFEANLAMNELAAECKAVGDRLPMPLSEKDNLSLVRTIRENWYSKILKTRFIAIDLRLVGGDYVMSNGQKPTWTPWSESEMLFKLKGSNYAGVNIMNNKWEAKSNLRSVSAFVCQQTCSKSSFGVVETTRKTVQTHCDNCKPGYKSFSIDRAGQLCFTTL